MTPMRIKPKLSFKLLGTSIQLDKNEIYDAEPATNQPDWERRGLVFVGDAPGFLLGKDDYTVVEDGK